ncbi:hypothetical protein JA33_262 [Dickeya phage vB_DsoM_JA33]|uniref:Uncharacterized protein n=2 Tax=Salmondvirus JA11 TaxID=2734141 RepID=A0A386K5Z0_9CAUD|nr:hypothetical protein HOU32_gp261 [Dickeya phage vB_DsoM_JA11]AXG67636.1 hypothetical protein JA33_262 [Dickeya phage vB_DsoM_JA33]AYD80066.1 hypothetical protein JA11_261 [Dickeya phage vB_DsoM_JA11]
MSHLFTLTHRRQKQKPSNHEHYHGDFCEKQYLIGMRLSAYAKELRKQIKFKRNSIETLRRHLCKSDNHELYWKEVRDAKNNPVTLAELRDKLAKTEAMLRTVKVNYELAFMVSRSFDRAAIQNRIVWESHRLGKKVFDAEFQTDLIIGIASAKDSEVSAVQTKILKGREVHCSSGAFFSLPPENEFGKHLQFPVTHTIRMTAKGEK